MPRESRTLLVIRKTNFDTSELTFESRTRSSNDNFQLEIKHETKNLDATIWERNRSGNTNECHYSPHLELLRKLAQTWPDGKPPRSSLYVLKWTIRQLYRCALPHTAEIRSHRVQRGPRLFVKWIPDTRIYVLSILLRADRWIRRHQWLIDYRYGCNVHPCTNIRKRRELDVQRVGNGFPSVTESLNQSRCVENGGKRLTFRRDGLIKTSDYGYEGGRFDCQST